ncbi:thioesterase [Labilibaculum filiforme]|uniref:Acyl-coenzyme A thioesterase THEM4 n=1 Tax=Labilibaculum filiforme TaxID=1940526 RepID=A0A2N3HTC9_9BACT|nr:PaaI family thioesterase [Labilibaculum filiforme]PKQ61324.1 thioesterase [Labilibaculum filiforme]
MKGIQDYYPDHFAQCYGCGRLNEHGHQIKTFWNGEETITRFVPKAYHTAIPGFVYGGLLASLIDCHGTGSAALALAKNQGIELSASNAPRCVTASLQVKYLKPTPIGGEIEIKGKIKEIGARKVIVEAELFANGVLCVVGEVVSVLVPDNFGL